MATGRALVVGIACLAASASLALAAAPQMRTLRDGVYTEEQAERGRKLFERVCVECHATTEFEGWLMGWVGMPVGFLYEQIRAQMPENNPGGLTRDEYADVMTYLFRINRLPAGNEEMSSESAALDAIVVAVAPPGTGDDE